MKKVFIYIALVMFLGVSADSQAQTLTKDAVLVGGNGNKITLGAPASVNAHKLLLPGTLGVANSLLYITSVGGSTVSTSWIPPGNSGDVLAYVGGALTWTPVASLPALTFWSLLGNSNIITDNTNNLLGTTTAAPLRLITGGAANTRVLISATGDVTVNGTAGTANTSMTSLGATTGSATGRIVLATATTGQLNALALPVSNGQILTSTTAGVLSWTSSPTLNFWGLTGNGHTVTDNTDNLLGTTTAAPLRIITGGAANTRIHITATGDVGIGTTPTSGRLLHVNGTAGTANVRLTSLSSTNLSTALAANDGLVIADANGDLTKRATSILDGTFVKYDVSATQNNSLTRTNNLFNVSYGAGANDANAAGASISSTGGATNRTATGLTLTATGTGTGISTGLSITASTGSGTATGLAVTASGTSGTRNAIDATGNVRLLSSGGTASILSFQNPAATFASTFVAGAQGANFNYTLPTTIPTAGQILTASAVTAPAVTLSWSSPGAGSNWTLTGNSGTTAGTNFIGTTDAIDWVVKTNSGGGGGERLRVTSGGRIGIGNISDVRTTVDINGDYGTRYTSLSLSNGVNNNINPGAFSYVRITGPTANFSIAGMRSGANGKRITVYNTTSYIMDFDYESATSVDTTRFHNPIATDVTIYAGGSASFIYDAVLNRWLLTSYTNGFVPQIASQILRRKAADETISAANTTMQDDDHLQWPVVTGQVWEVRGVMFIEAATANPDFNFQFVSPGGTGDSVSGYWRLYKLGGGGGGALNDADLITAYSTPSSSMNLSAGIVFAIEVNGVFVVGNTSGDIKIQWAKTTAVTDNLTVKKNSYLFITRIE